MTSPAPSPSPQPSAAGLPRTPGPAQAGAGRLPRLEALSNQSRYFVQAAWISLISGVLTLAPSWYMFEVYGRVLDSRNVRTLAMLLLCVLGVHAVVVLLELVRARVLQRAASEMDAQLRSRVFDFAFEATLRRVPGGATQLFNDLRVLRDFVPSPAVIASFDLPAALVFLFLVFMLSPWLGALALGGVAIQAVLLLITERKTMPLLSEAGVASNGATAYATGSLRNAPVIEAMGMLSGVHARWQQRQRRFLGLQSSASDHAVLTSALAKQVQTMQGSLLLGCAAWLLLRNELSGGPGMMIVASIIGGKVLSPLSQLVSQWRSVVAARDSLRRMSQAMAQQVERARSMPLPPPKGVLTVEAVSVSAGVGQPTILRNVSFGIRPGDALAVIGPAASGKTTLARVLIGHWPTVAGKVRLDGVDVHGWDKDELGPHVGYLPQAVELFDGTIAENIARFGKVDLDQVRAAAALAGLAQTVDELPQGYDTRIGDDGAILSGGQRQRVALARAVYGDPRFVVLDEPNSSLDEVGEKALIELIKTLRERKATVVIITHRTTVLPAVNALLVLRDGQVALFGPRDEVLLKMKKAAEEIRAAARPPTKVAP